MSKRIIAKEPNKMGLSRKRTSSGVNELSSRLTEANDTKLVRTCEAHHNFSFNI